MKKLTFLIALVVVAVIISTDQLPVKNWLVKQTELLATRYSEYLPLEMIGEKIFDDSCASCHDNPAMKAPTREALSLYSRENLMIAMEFGKMQAMASHLDKSSRKLIAHYLAGSDTESYRWIDENLCSDQETSTDKAWLSNWGIGNNNRRFVSDSLTNINRDNVASLQLQWSVAFPKVTGMRSQPIVIGDTLFIGDKAGKLYTLDRTTGCVKQHKDIISGVRSAITLATLSNGQQLLVFANAIGTVFAVDPITFETIWQQSVTISQYSVVTGSISYHNDQLFVPISSFEVAASGSPSHVCCTSHGAVVSLNAIDGEPRWEWHSTKDAELQGENRDGKPIYGPSGAPVWTTPAIDIKQNRIYFGTGENISEPATDTSDSIIALDMDSGELAWKFQATENDVWNAACLNGGANCPDNPGGDFDFGASVIIAELDNGSEILLAGQKSGEVFALNIDPQGLDGEVIWRNRISQGTTNGGIHWGMALSGQTLFVPVADPERDRDNYTPKPGLSAIDITTGEIIWQKLAQRGCEFDYAHKPLIGLENARAPKADNSYNQFKCSYHYGLSSAATSTSQLVFAGGLDGKMRSYDVRTGEVVWSSKTAIPFVSINGVKGHGGAIDVAGQIVAGDWLYVLSGYGMFGQLPGNVLLAYKIEK